MLKKDYDSIIIHDLKGNILVTNGACVVLTGFNIEELHNMTIQDLFSESTSQAIATVERQLIGGESPVNPIEVKLIRKDKSELFIYLSIGVVTDKPASTTFQLIARDISEHKRMQENLHYYLQQATRAQEEERKRIALELHDETIQDLIVLSRQLDTLGYKSKELSAENSALLKALQEQTKNIIRSLRQLSQDLRPVTMRYLGLLPSLEHLATETAEESGIDAKVSISGAKRRLPEEAEVMLFRIVQEALRNVCRHAQATKVDITVEFIEGKTRVAISDNGKGFQTPRTINGLVETGKLGLAGIQERARLINGSLLLKSEIGKGTTVTIEAPI